MKAKQIRVAKSAIIYCRVSTEEQSRDAHGLESQETTCRQFCQERGWTVREVFLDAGVSGWADVERPGFQQMMQSIRENKDVNLVFYDYSRFGRNVRPALQAFEKLDSLHVYTVAANNPGIDSRIAAGRTARRDELSRAEDYSDQHSEKTSARMKAAFEAGRWCRSAPLGYCTSGTKIKGAPNIIPVEPEATLIAKAFELVQRGLDSPSDILRTLDGMGLKSKKGKKVGLDVFLKMLRNPVYIGQMRSQEWGTVKGLHESIVSERVFRDVQLILSGKKPTAAPYERNREGFPLRRFLICSECDTPLTGGPSMSATGKKYDYYRCYRCHAVKSLRTEDAAAEFVELLKRLRPDHAITEEFATILEQRWAEWTVDAAANGRKINAELKEKRRLREKLLRKYLDDDPAIKHHFVDLKRGFDEEIASLEAQIATTEAETATFEQLWETSKSLLVDIATAWERGNLDQKQRVQNALFTSGLKYHPEKGILNSEIDCLFNDLEAFVGGKMSLVRPERFELPT
jgi:site-specific DNA recombinase